MASVIYGTPLAAVTPGWRRQRRPISITSVSSLRLLSLSLAQRRANLTRDSRNARIVRAAAELGAGLSRSPLPARQAIPSDQQPQLADVLERCQRALGLEQGTMAADEVVVRGSGRHLGIAITFTTRWRCRGAGAVGASAAAAAPAGAFLEEFSSDQLSLRWGYDGVAGHPSWEVDNSSISRPLECDDHEALLLAAWLRTGAWLYPDVMQQLNVRLVPSSEGSVVGGATAAAGSSGSSGSSSSSKSSNAAGGKKIAGGKSSSSSSSRPARASAKASAAAAADILTAIEAGGPVGTASSSRGSGGGDKAAAAARHQEAPSTARPVELEVSLVGGKLCVRLCVDPAAWLLSSFSLPLCGDVEQYELRGWRQWQPAGLWYPSEVRHTTSCGAGSHVFRPHSVMPAEHDAGQPAAAWGLPPTPLLPADTSWDDAVSTHVPVHRAASGHLLVAPAINGVVAGYMIVDTGASGFVITPEAATQLSLEPFGELFAAGISARVASQFARADSLSLGPLRICEPVFMRMPMAGLVRGGPGPVIGILGYDVFRRAVVEMPALTGQQAAAGSGLASKGRPAAGRSAAAAPTEQQAASTLVGNGNASGAGRTVPAAGSASMLDAAAGAAAAPLGLADKQQLAQEGATNWLRLHKLEEGGAAGQQEQDWMWHPLKMICGLPHVPATLMDAKGCTHELLLMLDSGACGADFMLHARAVSELGVTLRPARLMHMVRGVGGDGVDGLRVSTGEAPWLEMLGGLRYDRAKCLFTTSLGGLEMSMWSSGIICADLMFKQDLCLDYANRRVGVRRTAAASMATARTLP